MRTLVALVLGCALASVVVGAQNPSDAKRGQELWMTYTCYGCHGYSGNGGNGPKLAQGGRFNNATALTNYVRNPPRANLMPSYSTKVLSDDQLAAIYAFLKSVPPSPPAKDIPLLSDFR